MKKVNAYFKFAPNYLSRVWVAYIFRESAICSYL